MDIGRAIASLCSERKVSAAEVARRTGLSPTSMSKYKAGVMSPSLDALKSVADAIGCHAYELVARAEGVTVPVAGETDEDRQWRQKWLAIDPEARRAVEKLIDFLPRGDFRDDRKS